jgi:hypothetical protein
MLCQRAKACFWVRNKCPRHNRGYFSKAYPQQDRWTHRGNTKITHRYMNAEIGNEAALVRRLISVYICFEFSVHIRINFNADYDPACFLNADSVKQNQCGPTLQIWVT